MIERNGRRHEPAGLPDRQFDRGRRIDAPAGHADVAIEIDDFAVDTKPQESQGPRTAGQQLRHATIGLVDGQDRVVDRLVVLHLAQHREVVTVIVEANAAIEVRNTRDAQAAAEILEILAVGHLLIGRYGCASRC